eukprot:11574252-Ditylum_brightwellii.AAC.1
MVDHRGPVHVAGLGPELLYFGPVWGTCQQATNNVSGHWHKKTKNYELAFKKYPALLTEYKTKLQAEITRCEAEKDTRQQDSKKRHRQPSL